MISVPNRRRSKKLRKIKKKRRLMLKGKRTTYKRIIESKRNKSEIKSKRKKSMQNKRGLQKL